MCRWKMINVVLMYDNFLRTLLSDGIEQPKTTSPIK